jgi:hypothetical protein
MANEYAQYLNKIKDMFTNDQHYRDTMTAISEGKSTMTIDQKFNKKIFDMEWIDVIEDCLPSLDNIVRNPRRFITIEEDIIDISLARNISPESIRHLAQHTNYIASVDEEKGTVTPSKILNTAKEESFEVYENRFAFTLLKKLNDFVDKRYKELEAALINESSELTININSEYKYQGSSMRVELKATTNLPFDKFSDQNINMNEGATEGMTPLQRISRMHQIILGFLGSPFAKAMRNSAPVRPPITRTNVIKKEPNFKKALILWQFIESYDKKGFVIEKVNEHSTLPESLDEQYRHILFLNDLILENLANLHTDEQTLEELDEKVIEEEKSAQLEKEIEAQKQLEQQDKQNAQDEEKKAQEELEKEQRLDDDEFPSINLDLREVRKVYLKVKGDKTYNPSEYREITAALDRVIAQHNINQAKRDKKLQDRLIKAQKKEEERVRIKNKNDKKRELARRKKEAEQKLLLEKKEREAAIRAEKRKLREERLARRIEEQKRLEELMEKHEMDLEVASYEDFISEKINKDVESVQNEFDAMDAMDALNAQADFNEFAEEYKSRAMAQFETLLDKRIKEVDLTKVRLKKEKKQEPVILNLESAPSLKAEPKAAPLINYVHNDSAAVDILLELSNKSN